MLCKTATHWPRILNAYPSCVKRSFYSHVMWATGKATGWERERERERERKTKICVKLPGQRQLVVLVPLSYCLHESQGRVGLRTHGSLTLFMRRTRRNCVGEGTTINSIIVRVNCTLHAAQNLLNPLPSLDGCQDRIG